MTREEFMSKARTSAEKILEHKANGIMNLVQQAYAEGRRAAKSEYEDAFREGAVTVKRAVDKLLDVESYDAKGLFGIHNEKMAADKIRAMSAFDLREAEEKIDEWVQEQKGAYEVGQVVRDPLGVACVVTKIYTGDIAGILGGFHVLYADGTTARFPSGTEFEVLDTDGGTLSDLSEAIAEADRAGREEGR